MTVNLIMKGIPQYDPHAVYEHGEMFYVPEQDKVFVRDKYEGGLRMVHGEVISGVGCDAPYLPSNYRLPIGSCNTQEQLERFCRVKHRLPNPAEYEVILTGEYNELAICARYGIPTVVDYNSLTDVREITYDHAIDYLSEYQRAQQTEELRKNLKQRLNAIFGLKNDVDIKKVIFNDPATIVFWTDGTKTVVKCANEVFDPEKGLAMAIAKKAFGNEGNYYNRLKEWLPEEKCPTVTIPGFQEALDRVKNIGDHIKDAIDTINTVLGDEEE